MALVDSNTARLFVTRRGFLEERRGPDDDPYGYSKQRANPFNQKRYQRRVDQKHQAFAQETARAIEELVCLAALSGADVESVQAHPELLQLGGVGGLLRYDLAWV